MSARQRPGRSSLPSIPAISLAVLVGFVLTAAGARADPTADASARSASFAWDSTERLVLVSVSFRDVIDSEISAKLSRGLPITILFTAAVFRNDQVDPVSTTAQTCKITWHVWEEAYRLDISGPGTQQSRWTTTLEGVLRRCAEVSKLPIGDKQRLPPGSTLFLKAQVQVNPVSPNVIMKIKHWISRPSATSTARPGDALFSTFTGLFLKRIGNAERELRFLTLPVTLHAPARPSPPPPSEPGS